MNSIVLQCPLCTKPFQVLEEQTGSAVQCPSCNQAVMVPASAAPKPEPSPPQPSQAIFVCPVCSGQFGISEDSYGQQVGCPHCQSVVQIEAPDKPNPPPKPAPAPGPVIQTGRPSQVDEADLAIRPDQSERKPAKPKTTPSSKETETPSQKPVSNQRTTKPQTSEVPRSKSEPVEASAESPTAAEQETEAKTPAPAPEPEAFIPKNVDHLLPPRFELIDPEELAFRRTKNTDHAVVLPDGKGGLKKVDQRIVKVRHGDQEISLISLPPEVVRRKRMVQNTLFIIGGAILLAMIFALLNRAT